VAWNPNQTGIDDLKTELQYSTASLNNFIESTDITDHILSRGDWVASLPGIHPTVESSDQLISALVGQPFRIPVYDAFDAGDGYRIVNIALVQIDAPSDIQLNTTQIVSATFLEDVTGDCPQ
jgi:hypothetical protein